LTRSSSEQIFLFIPNDERTIQSKLLHARNHDGDSKTLHHFLAAAAAAAASTSRYYIQTNQSIHPSIKAIV
jgi:hypothetical protein